jgi:hypothetical protein
MKERLLVKNHGRIAALGARASCPPSRCRSKTTRFFADLSLLIHRRAGCPRSQGGVISQVGNISKPVSCYQPMLEQV